jgi:hypothetical protein
MPSPGVVSRRLSQLPQDSGGSSVLPGRIGGPLVYSGSAWSAMS